MIFLSAELQRRVMQDELMAVTDAAAIGLGQRAEKRWTTEAVAAAQRANEAAYWLAKDLAIQIVAQEAQEAADADS